MYFKLLQDTVTKSLGRARQVADNPRLMYEAGAKAMQVYLKQHMKDLQEDGNENGWKSSQFFSGGKNSVAKTIGVSKLSSAGAEVTIADIRFTHHIRGGKVYPKRREKLAIPLIEEAKKLSGQGSLEEVGTPLELLIRGNNAFLGVIEDGEPNLWFILKDSVTHFAHPANKPDETRMYAEAKQAMKKAVAILLKKL